MSFDGVLLNRILNELNILKTGRISKITESGDTDFIFTIRANRENHNVMLSFSSDFSRIHITKKNYDAPANPKSFTMFLRKHIEGYFIEDIKTYNCDRILYFVLSGFNEMQDYSKKYLICEVMGRYSNMILTDDEYRIIDALKHDGIGEYNRTILPNAIYEFPNNGKLNPLEYSYEELSNIIEEKKLSTPKDYMNTFNGVSLNITYPIFEEFNHIKAFYDYLHINNNPSIFTNFKGKTDYYYHNFNYTASSSFNSLSELLDEYYYKADLLAKVRLKTNDLLSFVSKHKNRNIKKIEKLEAEKLESSKNDDYRIYGELLLSCSNLKQKIDKIEVYNYYTNENITIKLDNKYNLLENSNRFFKKYQKLKTALFHIDEQINITKNEIEYFNVLEFQLKQASINEALEIQDELIEQKYIFKNITKQKKKQKPKLLTYIIDDTLISVGKNNIQNEYLTHKLSKPNEMWFHIKDGAGSHVVIHKDNDLTEEEIRAAAMLAAYYSTYSDSSSVAVDYTKIRNIKKIPGKRNCFVTYTHQKTIYIDPDKNIINSLKVKK